MNGLVDRAAVEQAVASTLDRVDQLIAGARVSIGTFSGDTLRLVVLPEYFLTSFPMGESIREWRTKACIEMDGAEYKRMGEIARSRGVYLSGNAYELDPHFPDLYFQTSFIISDEGRRHPPLPPSDLNVCPLRPTTCCHNIATFMETTVFPRRPYTPRQTGLRSIRGNLVSGSSARIGNPRRRGDPALIK